ncbi:conserved hypothetical protein [Methanococcus maripaludis C5]|uniref:DUF4129 domain-containing protein n=1 Tax=Methanococcus maripaludis (strain C5 / ATCC BAA-1333) TaxID=402880 RepID=A4FZI5_METM5|nr:hypothetical protein [Methanococcus maripaludis]ABO35619.1 conserved hypothetical protein [Methanococcus maripaludis C5]
MNSYKPRILLLIFIIYFFSTVSAANITDEQFESDDTYIYTYFNNFLMDYTNSIDKMIVDDITYINDSEFLYEKINYMAKEVITYEYNSINSPAGDVIDPYYSFSKDLNELSILNKEFNEQLENNTLNSKYSAKITVVKILSKIGTMRSTLDTIDNITTLQIDNRILTFDTSEVRKSLDYYELKILKKAELLEDLKPNENLTLFISPEVPIIYEDTLIYGTGKNGNAKIVIIGPENIVYNITINENNYLKNHVFEKPGIYRLYAVQDGKRSEVVIANVSKIPTQIIMEGHYMIDIFQNKSIGGTVVDFHENPVDSGHIVFENETLELTNGMFKKNIYSEVVSSEKYIIKFLETEKYLPSEKIIEVIFSKKPVAIRIYSETPETKINSPITIFGEYYGLDDSLELKLWLNGKLNSTFKSDSTFEKELVFDKSGTYEIYVTYDGNEQYSFSKSNTIKIKVTEKSMPLISNTKKPFILLFLVIIGLIIAIYKKMKKNEKVDLKELSSEKETCLTFEDSETPYTDTLEIPTSKIETSISSKYMELYNKIISKYEIRSKLTPRELLNYIKENNYPLYDELKFITEIHEKHNYEKSKIDRNTEKGYYKSVDNLLEML